MKKIVLFKKAYHICPVSDGPKPHVGGKAIESSSTVQIEKSFVCRKGDAMLCNSPQKDKISTGSNSVFIENEAVAKIGDSTEHGGTVTIGGSTTVFIS